MVISRDVQLDVDCQSDFTYSSLSCFGHRQDDVEEDDGGTDFDDEEEANLSDDTVSWSILLVAVNGTSPQLTFT